MQKQIPRRISHANSPSKKFDYSLNYKTLDLRKNPDFYQVGIGEQGVLLVEPYKSEILPHWRFKTPQLAEKSARSILRLFNSYKKNSDFIGMDMARKFLQMGYTRSRRYANHKSGVKYDKNNNIKPYESDPTKALSAEFFKKAWMRAEEDLLYRDLKTLWKLEFG